ncbi:MAG TPA: hypothetical protein PLB01_00275 [Thermoanaerobaculia bacterium]|nr:hypothetical protein [Thermoanaerobaculia bacterium]
MRVYDITQKNVSLTAAVQTVIEFTAATNQTVVVLRAWISQSGSTTSAQQNVNLIRKTAAGTNATAPNANPVDASDTAFAGTVRGLCTTEGTLGVDLIADSFNWVNGWIWLPVPEERIYVKGGAILGLRLPTAPPALTCNAGITVGELG